MVVKIKHNYVRHFFDYYYGKLHSLFSLVAISKITKFIQYKCGEFPHVQNKQKKDDILRTRLKRDLGKVFSFWRHVSLPRDRMFDWLKDNYGKLKELERDLRRRSQEQFNTTLSKSQTIDELLIQAKTFLNNEEYSAAEEILIDALSFDEFNVDVYKLFANVYREKKEYEQAKETLKYLLKLTHNKDTAVFISLAEISKVRGNLKQAEEEYLQSISLSDDNHLNFLSLAEVYLELDYKQQLRDRSESFGFIAK